MSDPDGTSYFRARQVRTCTTPAWQVWVHREAQYSALSRGLLSSVVISVFPASRLIAVSFGECSVPSAHFKGVTEVKALFRLHVEKKTASFLLQLTLLSVTSLKQHHHRNYDERTTFSMNATQAGSHTLRTESLSSALVGRGVRGIYIML